MAAARRSSGQPARRPETDVEANAALLQRLEDEHEHECAGATAGPLAPSKRNKGGPQQRSAHLYQTVRSSLASLVLGDSAADQRLAAAAASASSAQTELASPSRAGSGAGRLSSMLPWREKASSQSTEPKGCSRAGHSKRFSLSSLGSSFTAAITSPFSSPKRTGRTQAADQRRHWPAAMEPPEPNGAQPEADELQPLAQVAASSTPVFAKQQMGAKSAASGKPSQANSGNPCACLPGSSQSLESLGCNEQQQQQDR